MEVNCLSIRDLEMLALLTFKSIESIKKRLAVLGIFYLYFYIVTEEKTRRIMKINGRSSSQCYGIVVYVIPSIRQTRD